MLHGRQTDLIRIEALLQSAREGEGRALMIEGDPGMGKTALLEAATREATDMEQVETAGLEAESSLPFSALAELTERLLDGISTLPRPQARAIEGALALTAPAPGARFAVCAGFLGLLVNAARERPLLVVVDDAQWLDRASGECLGYAARRLDGLPIAFLAASRAGEAHPLSGPKIERITLSGLDPVAARATLMDLDSTFPSQVAEALVESAAGNPLALVELPALLTPEQRAGSEPLEHPLPPGASLQRAFDRRIAQLPSDARGACLVAAAALSTALGPIQAAAAALGLDKEGLEVAEQAGIVALSAERIDFAHPLLRGAVYQGAEAAERRRAHQVLSEHAGDEDARAWHLAAAAIGPDAAAADALEAAAERARARGAHGAAADALERAARLTDDREPRTRRLLAAGLAATIGGAYDRGVTLMELADEIDDPIMRASVRHPLALATLNGGLRTAYDTEQMLSEEAERIASIDPAASAAMHADAGVAAGVAGNCRQLLASAERASALLPADAEPSGCCHVLSMLGMGLALRGRTDEARDALDRAGELLAEVDPLAPVAQSIAFGLGARRCTGQERRLSEEAALLEAATREAGADGLFPYCQVLVADCAFRMGDWQAARRDIEAAIEGAEESGQRGSLANALVLAARMHAACGEEQAARSDVERATRISESCGYGSPLGWGLAALGFLELSLDQPLEAITTLEPIEQLFEFGGLEDPLMIPWAPDLVEAYSRAGRADDAGRVAAKLAVQATANGTPLAAALAARCAGLVGDQPDEDFAAALEAHDRADSPFERARTLLALGGRLHRDRRRVQAREHLREALAGFEQLGATPWAERARAELRAAGAIKREPIGNPDELTGQEERVALAVARGATNREVAAALFLSPKTIEFHLGRVYRKLGIHSRTELAGLVAEGRLSQAAAEDGGDGSGHESAQASGEAPHAS